MDIADIVAVLVLVWLVVIIVVAVVQGIREAREDGHQGAHDPCDGAYRESLLVRDETGYLTPEQAEAYLTALEEEPEPLVRTHCPACIIAMCDEWGISLDRVRTAGTREYCREHKDSILARARQGA